MNPRSNFIQGDIGDAVAVRAGMQGCDTLVHFAAETHADRSIYDPAIFIHTNVKGTLVLLETARVNDVRRFIQISADEVYDNAEAPDGTSQPSHETGTFKPLSPYAASQVGADRLAFSYWAMYDLPVLVTRCSNNYGPYQRFLWTK